MSVYLTVYITVYLTDYLTEYLNSSFDSLFVSFLYTFLFNLILCNKFDLNSDVGVYGVCIHLQYKKSPTFGKKSEIFS